MADPADAPGRSSGEGEPPGWLRHPDHDAIDGYWDGRAWTGEYRFHLEPDVPAPGAQARLPGARQPYLTGWRTATALPVLIVGGLLILEVRARACGIAVAFAGGIMTPARRGAAAFLLPASAFVSGLIGYVGVSFHACGFLASPGCHPAASQLVATTLLMAILGVASAVAGMWVGTWADRIT